MSRKEAKNLNWLVLFVVLFFPDAIFAEMFKWVDQEGNTHFTDDYLKVPGKYKQKVTIKELASPATEGKEPPDKAAGKETVPSKPAEPVPPAEKEISVQEEKEKGEVVSIVGQTTPKVDAKGNLVFAGKVKNNTKEVLSSVEIVFNLMDRSEKVIKTITSPVSGQIAGTLKGGETGTYETITTVPYGEMGSYQYSINWKSFAK